MLNAIVDTNVFLRGLLGSPSNRAILLSLKDNGFNLIISQELFEEFLEVVRRTKFHSILIPEAVYNLSEIIKVQAKFVSPRQRVNICRDKEDRKILECALEGADCIVTNDKDLLILKAFHNIPIVTPRGFLKLLKR